MILASSSSSISPIDEMLLSLSLSLSLTFIEERVHRDFCTITSVIALAKLVSNDARWPAEINAKFWRLAQVFSCAISSGPALQRKRDKRKLKRFQTSGLTS